jgi:hypothetical protein
MKVAAQYKAESWHSTGGTKESQENKHNSLYSVRDLSLGPFEYEAMRYPLYEQFQPVDLRMNQGNILNDMIINS